MLITTSIKFVKPSAQARTRPVAVMEPHRPGSHTTYPDMMDTSFFVGRVMIVAQRSSPLSAVKRWLFEAMHRNALAATEFFRVPQTEWSSSAGTSSSKPMSI